MCHSHVTDVCSAEVAGDRMRDGTGSVCLLMFHSSFEQLCFQQKTSSVHLETVIVFQLVLQAIIWQKTRTGSHFLCSRRIDCERSGTS